MKKLLILVFLFLIPLVTSYSFIDNNTAIIQSSGINSSITFSLNCSFDHLEVSSNYITILNVTTPLVFCPLVNLTTQNTTLDSKDFCLVSGGHGGGGPIVSYNTSALCLESNDFVYQNTKNGKLSYSNEDFNKLKDRLNKLGISISDSDLTNFLLNYNKNCPKPLIPFISRFNIFIIISVTFFAVFAVLLILLDRKYALFMALSMRKKKEKVNIKS